MEQHRASKSKPRRDRPEETIAFACQECGKSITFPADRGGHVEECPECGSYVDVPHAAAASEFASGQAGAAQHPRPQLRTTAQLWIEVSAVLCLAYLPWLFSAVVAVATDVPRINSFTYDVLHRIVHSLQISMPLLVILALTRDRWSLFGIVRPKWIIDVLGCVIWAFCAALFYDFVMTLLPSSLLECRGPRVLQIESCRKVYRNTFCLFIALIAISFAEELIFRGYLIPRFERLLRSTLIAVLVTTAMFASYHVYEGVVAVIGTAAIGFVYAIAFCLLRRLWPLCVAHALANIMLFLAPHTLKRISRMSSSLTT